MGAKKIQPSEFQKEELNNLIKEVDQKKSDYLKCHNISNWTRRDFLASGIIPFAATAVAANISLLPFTNKAHGQTLCSVDNGVSWAPLITLNLQGGSGLSSHWLPLDEGKQLLPTYSKMGWGKSSAFSVDYEFANKAPFFSGSTLLAGIRATAGLTSLNSTSFVGMAIRSQDDSTMNKFDITGLTKGVGLKGKLLANIGTLNTGTGNATQPAYMNPPAPLVVSRFEDLTGALSVSGSLAQMGSKERITGLFSLIQRLSSSQSAKYAGHNNGAALQRSIACYTQDNTQLMSGNSTGNLDPRQNQQVATTWGIQGNTTTSAENYVFGSLTYNAIMGNIGSVNLRKGGYDYHNGTRTTGDANDQNAGRIIGQILRTAEILNKKVFILVTSDGSVTSAESDLPGSAWASDGGVRGAAYMLAFDPSGKKLTDVSQLGHFTQAQAADDRTIVGSSPERAAASMFINYLSFNNRISDLDKVLPRVFNSDEISKVKVIG
jgi:hypothetical protein